GPHNPANARYLAELISLAKAAGRVHLLYALGIRAPYRLVTDLYALADALVLPSQNEGFGIPLLEAALHRLPIVTSDLPTLRALAGDAAAYVAPDSSGEAIADTVQRVLDHPLARFRSRARALAWPRVLAEQVVPPGLGGADGGPLRPSPFKGVGRASRDRGRARPRRPGGGWGRGPGHRGGNPGGRHG